MAKSKSSTLEKDPFVSVRQIGLGGLIAKGDAQDIQDIESPDLRNISLDGGIIGPRYGTTLFLATPTGETGTPSQLLKATDSNGTAYLIGVYGTNFYLLDETKPQWILLNSSYSPTKTGLFYGSADWNKGLGSDAFYFCNGSDSVIKWQQSLGFLSAPALITDATLTLTDSSTFPTSGTVVIMDNTGTPFTATITGNVSNVLTLSAPVGHALNLGNALTMTIIEKAGMPIGKIIRAMVIGTTPKLFTANKVGAESTLNWSKDSSPEDFSIVASADTGGNSIITAGEGGILDFISFGSFAVVIKQNAFIRFNFVIDTTNNALVVQADPLEFGASVLPIGMRSSIIAENDYYYPTKSQGIYQFVPSATGGQTSTQNTPISDGIFPLLQNNIDFSMGTVSFYRRMILWTCSTIPNVNNLILIRDMVFNAWTVWDNMNTVGMQEVNDTLYFLSLDDGGIYFYDTTSYQDSRKGQAIGYETYLYTKRFDFGYPANPKTQTMIMVQGYITTNTLLYVTALANENGSLAKVNYVIDGNNSVYVKQIPVFGIGRSNLGQNAIGGSQIGTIGAFRVYLSFPKGFGAHTMQLAFTSLATGDNWGVTGVSFNSEVHSQIPSELVLSTS